MEAVDAPDGLKPDRSRAEIASGSRVPLHGVIVPVAMEHSTGHRGTCVDTEHM